MIDQSRHYVQSQGVVVPSCYQYSRVLSPGVSGQTPVDPRNSETCRRLDLSYTRNTCKNTQNSRLLFLPYFPKVLDPKMAVKVKKNSHSLVAVGAMGCSSPIMFWAMAFERRYTILSFCRLKPSHMSRAVRKPAFCICENKDADQLRGDREADQRLCFHYIDSTIPLPPISEISSL